MKNKYEGLTKEDIIYVNNLDWRDYKEHLISQIVLRNTFERKTNLLAERIHNTQSLLLELRVTIKMQEEKIFELESENNSKRIY